MKDLVKIIEDLHNINRQVIEKDNVINQNTDLINLCAQLIGDPQFVKSDIYLDMRLKYINKIEEKLKKINESNVTIEPEYMPPNLPDKQVISKEITAPIKTDIYVAPNSRRQFAKKKTLKAKSKAGENPSNIEKKPQYIEFERNQQTYYIETVPLSGGVPPETYNIFINTGNRLQIAGHLKGPSITLLNTKDLSKCENIKLETLCVDQLSPSHEKLLNNYVLI